MRVSAVLETCLYVDDLEQAEKFYGEVLGLRFASRQPGRHVFFRCGQQMVLLFDPRGSSSPNSDLPPHGTQGSGHVAFAVEPEAIPGWQDHLMRHEVVVEKVVEWPGGGRSLYFRDPAGNSLELATPHIWGVGEPKEPT